MTDTGICVYNLATALLHVIIKTKQVFNGLYFQKKCIHCTFVLFNLRDKLRFSSTTMVGKGMLYLATL